MLSTVLEVGAIVALIGGTAYFFFQYAPMIVSTYNQVVTIVWEISDYIPDYLKDFIPVVLLLSGIGLVVKLL